MRLDEAVMAERKEKERGIGGGRMRRKKGSRGKVAPKGGEAEALAGTSRLYPFC